MLKHYACRCFAKIRSWTRPCAQRSLRAWSRMVFFTGFFFRRMVAHGRCVFNGLWKNVPRHDSGLASIAVDLISTLLEMVPFVVDLLWTQDSPIFPLMFGGKTGPHIDQGGSRLRVYHYQAFSTCQRLLTVERSGHP